MKTFEKFLRKGKTFLQQLPLEPHRIHLILGNESCDLDSTVSALTLGYFLSSFSPDDKVVIPILNVSNREEFLLRTENCFVLKQEQIDFDNLVFRDDLKLDEIISRHYQLEVSLVDHHVLNKNDEILKDFVVEIIDHRPVDPNYCLNVKKTLIQPVGSCCTLIADRILKQQNINILNTNLAYLLYQTIIFDTIGLNPANHRATKQDIDVAEELAKIYNFSEEPQTVFDRLWAVHNDVSQLTPGQLLKKDLKVIEGVYIPGLPMLVVEFLDLPNALETIEEFAQNHSVETFILIGLNASMGVVQRDLAIFSQKENLLKHTIVETLMKAENLQLEERPIVISNKLQLFHVNNTKISRKQIVPLVRDAWQEYINKK